MKSLFIFIFFTIILYITYQYSYQKFYTDKIKKEIKFLVMPIMIDDFFKYNSLEDKYRDIFNKPSINLSYEETISDSDSKSEVDANSKSVDKTKPMKLSLQRYFTQF